MGDLSKYGAHTPGPWRWSDGYRNGAGEETWSLLGSDGYGVLSCDMPNAPQNCNGHDADLIADAPLLLAEVARLREQLAAALYALEAIAGVRPWIDDLMSDKDIAREIVAALTKEDAP